MKLKQTFAKKKKRKRERFFACRCSHLRKRDHILDNCERALGKYRFDYPFDRSFYPLFSFFFFFSPMRTLKFSAWPLSCSCNPLRIYRFHTPLNAMHSSIPSLVTLFLFFPRCVSCFLIARLVAITLFRRSMRIYYLEQRRNTNKIHTRRIK